MGCGGGGAGGGKPAEISVLVHPSRLIHQPLLTQQALGAELRTDRIVPGLRKWSVLD